MFWVSLAAYVQKKLILILRALKLRPFGYTHHSGPLLPTFEGPEQGFGSKNCQNGSGKKPLYALKGRVSVFLIKTRGK